jgi:hypothetical protein
MAQSPLTLQQPGVSPGLLEALYEGFFDAKVGFKSHVWFQPIMADGSFGQIERGESVEVPSKNYRFELTSVKGLPYPAGPERPIGVFLRTGRSALPSA